MLINSVMGSSPRLRIDALPAGAPAPRARRSSPVPTGLAPAWAVSSRRQQPGFAVLCQLAEHHRFRVHASSSSTVRSAGSAKLANPCPGWERRRPSDATLRSREHTCERPKLRASPPWQSSTGRDHGSGGRDEPTARPTLQAMSVATAAPSVSARSSTIPSGAQLARNPVHCSVSTTPSAAADRPACASTSKGCATAPNSAQPWRTMVADQSESSAPTASEQRGASLLPQHEQFRAAPSRAARPCGPGKPCDASQRATLPASSAIPHGHPLPRAALRQRASISDKERRSNPVTPRSVPKAGKPSHPRANRRFRSGTARSGTGRCEPTDPNAGRNGSRQKRQACSA